jgi:hypothetical protein
LNAVLNNNRSMSFRSSSYRERLNEQEANEQACAKCERYFSTQTQREQFGCNHLGDVIHYRQQVTVAEATDRIGRDVAENKSRAEFLHVLTRDLDARFRAKWKCCGKTYLDDDCSKCKHTLPVPLHQILPAPGIHLGVFNRNFWCNLCAQAVDAPRCVI